MAPKTTTLSGKLDVSVTDDGLEALMSFEPGGSGEEIDMSYLSRLLSGKNVREGISAKDLEALFGRLKSAKEAFSVTVAKGIPPQKPVPETPVWENLPVPAGLEEDSKKAFAYSDPPAIYVEKVEQIKKEKILLKKSLIPFAPPKKEKVVEIEKKVSKKRLEVDAEVLGRGYAEAGTVIAGLEPFQAGKPGKTVTGAMIPAEALADPYVYAGEGIQKKGGKLTALRAGFIRWGKNWAEILPFRSHAWAVTLSSGKTSCLLSLTPGDAGAAIPTAEDIRRAATALPYEGELLLCAADIEALAKKILSGGQAQTVSITVPEDALTEIKVSEDKLEASLILRKGRGSGKVLSLKDVGALIQSSGIKGLNLQKIKADVLAFYKSDNHALENYILAKGRPASAGSPAAIQWNVKFMPVKDLEELKKLMPGAASPAYRGIESIKDFPISAVEMAAAVQEKEQLLSLKPGKPGTAGVDVYGEAVPPRAGQESGLILRENVEQAGNAVIAAIAGILETRDAGGKTECRVRPHRDGKVEVSLSPNKMEAFITFIPPAGTGKPLKQDEISGAITRAGVVYRAQRQDVLESLMTKSGQGESFTNVSFARGQPATDGLPRRINVLVHIASGSQVNIRGDGKADFKNIDTITSVKKGDALAQILSPETVSRDGWDVTGAPVPAKNDFSETFTVGKNVREEVRDGKTLLIADVNGELQFDEKSISIREGYVIQGNVDLKTGNIKFPGSVFVSGSVDSGFFIFAGGDIKINGGIEAALLSAEESISIEQGVKGKGKAVLRSKKNISTSFAEQAVIMSVGDIEIKNGCIRCTIKCNGKIALPTEKGALIGGVVKSRLGIDAAVLGTERGVQTEISFGQDYLLADQIESAEKAIQKLNVATSKLNVLMREAGKNGDKAKLESCRAEKLRNLKQIERMNYQLITLREKFEEHFPAEILVREILYPGVVIESHGRYYEAKEPKKRVRLFFDETAGKIVETYM